MPMTKDQKAVAVEEISQKLDQAPTVYITNYSGLSVAKANELRGRFRAAGVEFKVLKNTLVRLAMEQKGGYDELFEQLNGPTAVAFCEEPAAPARVIKKFLSDNGDLGLPQLKGAYIDGAVYGPDALDVLASLKSKDELIADIAGLLMAPINNIASALNAQGAGLASVIQQLSEKEEG